MGSIFSNNHSSQLRKNSFIKITIIAMILIAYFAGSIFIINSIYDKYADSASAFEVISSRNSISLLLGILYAEAIGNNDPKLFCVNNNTENTVYSYVYPITLEIENAIINYQKSGNSIFNDFNDIISELNSDAFCSYTVDPISIIGIIK